MTATDKEAILTLSAISSSKDLNLNVGQIKKVFENLVFTAIIQFSEKNKCVIPLLGDLLIEYSKDTINNGFRQPDFKFSFSPSSKLLSYLNDFINSNLEPTLIEQELHKRNLKVFEEKC